MQDEKLDKSLQILGDFYGIENKRKSDYKNAYNKLLDREEISDDLYSLFFLIYLYYDYWYTISCTIDSFENTVNYQAVFQPMWEDENVNELVSLVRPYYSEINEFIVETNLDKVALFSTYLDDSIFKKVDDASFNAEQKLNELKVSKEVLKWLKTHLNSFIKKYQKCTLNEDWPLAELYYNISNILVKIPSSTKLNQHLPIFSILSNLDSAIIIELYKDLNGLPPDKYFVDINNKRKLWRW